MTEASLTETSLTEASLAATPLGNRSARASMCRVTPPGYVHEYGDTRAIRI